MSASFISIIKQARGFFVFPHWKTMYRHSQLSCRFIPFLLLLRYEKKCNSSTIDWQECKSQNSEHLIYSKIACSGGTACSFTKTGFSIRIFFFGGGRISRVTVLPSCCYIAQKMKFSTKDFFSDFGNCKLQTANLVTFTGEIVIGKPSFFVHW